MLFGLIGKKLSHSLSAQLFNRRFYPDHTYSLYEISDVREIFSLIEKNPQLKGLNVTIPFKTEVISLLDIVDEDARLIGAVNTLLIEGRKLSGFNTDVIGFEKAYNEVLRKKHSLAIVLGTGGASRAVCYVLEKYSIPYKLVSRSKKNQEVLTYYELSHFSEPMSLIINTTPFGMYPKINEVPPLPDNVFGKQPDVIDIIYNPSKTLLMIQAEEKGCTTFNGMEMLKLQAYESWKIWGLL